ncbi:MAG: hypothetical protein QXF26_09815 [Candidatus Bathyarchaeia archaeon]
MSKTTVKVDRATLQALKELKDKFGAKSFDEAIRTLIRQVRGIPKSKFGAPPDMKPFTEKDEASSHEL